MQGNRSPHVSNESFDKFLAEEGILASCEREAIGEIVAEQKRSPNRVKVPRKF